MIENDHPHAFCDSCIENLATIFVRCGQRFLAVAMFARGNHGQADFGVRFGDSQVDDDVDVRVGEHFFDGFRFQAIGVGQAWARLWSRSAQATISRISNWRSHQLRISNQTLRVFTRIMVQMGFKWTQRPCFALRLSETLRP